MSVFVRKCPQMSLFVSFCVVFPVAKIQSWKCDVKVQGIFLARQIMTIDIRVEQGKYVPSKQVDEILQIEDSGRKQ
jgi:hypothetical protein